MDACPECGNHDMHTVELDGATVIECGLCGERFGERRAVSGRDLADEATERGIDPIIWPLARVLEQLPGLALGSSSAGSATCPPSVELVVTGQDALLQIENLAKSMRLSAGSLRCPWLVEARFEHSLVFVVRADLERAALRDARIDIEMLAQNVDRDMRLTWWRCANVAENG